MNIWYQKCLEYYDSVPEYRDKIDLSNFTEKTACDAIKRAGMLCEEKQFSKDPDYVVRMDRMMKVMQELQYQLPSLSRLFEITCPPAIDSISLLAEAKQLLFEQNMNINLRLAKQQQELEALHARHVALDEKHRIDHLTQLANRSWIERQLTQYFDDAKQAQQPLSVVFIDLDHFKQINDRFGHRFGDKVLVQFAATLKHMIRENDLAGRYGGERKAPLHYGLHRHSRLHRGHFQLGRCPGRRR